MCARISWSSAGHQLVISWVSAGHQLVISWVACERVACERPSVCCCCMHADADGMARAFTVLIETTDQKGPPASTYGGEAGVYAPGSADDGNVPRNMRLALVGIDLVQPYVKAWIPADAGAGSAAAGGCIPVRFEVWGAVRVDEASVVWRAGSGDPWRAIDPSQKLSVRRTAIHTAIRTAIRIAIRIAIRTGSTPRSHPRLDT